MALRKEDTVIATFDEEELFTRLDDGVNGKVAAYIRENDLTDAVVLSAVEWLRFWYNESMDKEHDAMRYAMERHIGKGKLDELGEW